MGFRQHLVAVSLEFINDTIIINIYTSTSQSVNDNEFLSLLEMPNE